MRNWMSVVLMAIAMAACHPRYLPLEKRGVGGSGGLDSIRTRILAAIAMRDYQHARDLLELAEGFTQQERNRLEWAIAAAERDWFRSWRKRCRTSSVWRMATSRSTRPRRGS